LDQHRNYRNRYNPYNPSDRRLSNPKPPLWPIFGRDDEIVTAAGAAVSMSRLDTMQMMVDVFISFQGDVAERAGERSLTVCHGR
jgi:hypothetical protein